MKTELRFEPYKITGHRVGDSSWYPAIRELIKSEISAELDEDDGLFIGYGMMPDGLPYTMQDQYDTIISVETCISFLACPFDAIFSRLLLISAKM